MSPGQTPSASLSSLYGDYYKDDKERVWRALGAKDKADHVLQLCGSLTPETVLEVGCGDGAVLQELDRRGFGTKLYGVEISESGVEATRARNLPSLVSVQSFSGYELPFEADSMDLIVSTHVLEHVEHERLFLKELGRVGRHILIEVPLENTLRVSKALNNTIGHINFYNRHQLRSLLETTGLEILDCRSFDHSVELLSHGRSPVSGRLRKMIRSTAHRANARLAEQMFTYHMTVLCRSAQTRT